MGAEWIDELASEAKALIPDGGEELIVHSDWSGKHFRFNGDGNITVVYDWDSLGLRTEAQALGIAAATFTSNLELEVFYAPPRTRCRPSSRIIRRLARRRSQPTNCWRRRPSPPT